MNGTSVVSLTRRALPTPAFSVLRRLGTALLTPLSFSVLQGHLQSSLAARAIDRQGRPLPWYTYPAIQFLLAKDVRGRHVLEWGAGQSSIWWAARAERVVSFDSNPDWLQYVRRQAAATVELHLAADSNVNEAAAELNEQFDIIVIDGFDRLRCAQQSLGLLASGGAIILDNSEGYWGEIGTFPILDLFRQNGFQRVDFYGFAPGVVTQHCTSLFFKGSCFLLSGAENVRRT